MGKGVLDGKTFKERANGQGLEELGNTQDAVPRLLLRLLPRADLWRVTEIVPLDRETCGQEEEQSTKTLKDGKRN